MKKISLVDLHNVSGAGGGLGEVITGLGHAAEGAVHVADAATGEDFGEHIGAPTGVKSYCSNLMDGNDNNVGSGEWKKKPQAVANYKDCLAKPEAWGYKG
ncbi:hypothetical protein AU825_23660 [Salmonella enterica subsp. salamae]|nr:hypothetical protein [Salmonella enterica subsp. salamae]ECF6094736.1 hypothetical protein [Salmonella enterica subsp. salamae]EDW5994079.1 hypothetical protein [Salmonella enterica subsp. salamae]